MKNSRNFLFIIISFMTMVLYFGCVPSVDSTLIPSYIRIDTICVKDNPTLNEGSLSHKITDAWIYVDNELIGAFELPTTVPVLHHGDVEIMIQAGIMMNGIAKTRVPYPFYSSYKLSGAKLEQEKVLEISPEVSYNNNIIIPWEESFEGETIRLKTENSDTIIVIDKAVVFEGDGSGKVVMDGDDRFFEMTSDIEFPIPLYAETSVFIELNFKIDHPVTVGLYAINPARTERREIVHLNKTDHWKKIYVNATPSVIHTPKALKYKVFISALRKDDDQAVNAYFDNIKLIYNTKHE